MNPQHYHVTAREIHAEPKVWIERLYKNKVLVLKGLTSLSPEELWDVHAVFGVPWNDKEYIDSVEAAFAVGENKFSTDYGTVSSKSRIGTQLIPWHRDIPWHREKRYPIRGLSPRVLDNSTGQVTTDFCDCDVLWDRIPSSLWDTINRTTLVLQYWYDAALGKGTTRTLEVPLCETHPYTLKKSVLLNSFGPKSPGFEFSTASTGAWIIGARRDGKDIGLGLINDLHRLVVTEDNIYRHTWEFGDVVLFDNLSGVFHSRSSMYGLVGERAFTRLNLKHFKQP